MDQKNESPIQEDFNRLIKFVSSYKLQTYFSFTSDAFMKLEINAKIKALYDLSIYASEEDILEKIHLLIMAILFTKETKITSQAYEHVKFVHSKTWKTSKKPMGEVFVFVNELHEALFVEKPLPKDIKFDYIVNVTNKLFELIKKASTLYYQKSVHADEKEYLKITLSTLDSFLIQEIDGLVKLVLKKSSEEDYPASLEFILTSVEKALPVKGLTSLFGAEFLQGLGIQKKCILHIQNTNQFLNYDFSKKILLKQEKEIVKLLDSFMTVSSLGIFDARPTVIFTCCYQLNTILAKKENSRPFRNLILDYYKNLKGNLLNYIRAYTITHVNRYPITLTVFSVMLLDLNLYHQFEGIKERLQAEMKEAFEESPTPLNRYFYFYIQVLNYITLFQDKELSIRTKELETFTKTLIEIQKLDFSRAQHYIFQEGVGRLLEYFANHIAIPLEVEVSDCSVYWTELQRFYTTFLGMAKHFSCDIEKNQIIQIFVVRLKQRIVLEQEYPALKEKRLEIAEKIQTVIQHFRYDVMMPFKIIVANKAPYNFNVQYELLCNVLTEAFPKMKFAFPKNWDNVLRRVFSDEDLLPNGILIFIVGTVCQDRKEEIGYRLALRFYSYCLEHKFFEESKTGNEAVFSITRERIEKHIGECKKALASVNVVPSVFEKGSVTPSATPQPSPSNQAVDAKVPGLH